MLLIPEEILEEVKIRKIKEKNIKIYRRLLFLEMKSSKKLNKEISSLLDVSIETLSHWTGIYKEGGVSALCELHYEGRRPGVLLPLKSEIEEYVKDHSITTIKQLKHWIFEEYDISLGIAWIQRFCKKNSIYLIKKHD